MRFRMSVWTLLLKHQEPVLAGDATPFKAQCTARNPPPDIPGEAIRGGKRSRPRASVALRGSAVSGPQPRQYGPGWLRDPPTAATHHDSAAVDQRPGVPGG